MMATYAYHCTRLQLFTVSLLFKFLSFYKRGVQVQALYNGRVRPPRTDTTLDLECIPIDVSAITADQWGTAEFNALCNWTTAWSFQRRRWVIARCTAALETLKGSKAAIAGWSSSASWIPWSMCRVSSAMMSCRSAISAKHGKAEREAIHVPFQLVSSQLRPGLMISEIVTESCHMSFLSLCLFATFSALFFFEPIRRRIEGVEV